MRQGLLLTMPLVMLHDRRLGLEGHFRRLFLLEHFYLGALLSPAELGDI